MTQKEFIKDVASKANVTQIVASDVVSAAIDVTKEALKKGDKVQLSGFGSFEVSKRAARDGKNPLTGEKIRIAAKNSPKFKAAKAFKEALN